MMPKSKTILLVFRDEERIVVKYEEFESLKEAEERTIEAQKTWKGEVVRCFGPSFEAIMNTYPEYRIAGLLDDGGKNKKRT